MESTNEVWMEVKNYDGKYQVSSLGLVKSFHQSSEGKLMSMKINKNGYGQFMLHLNGVHKALYIHKLMWETFIGEVPPGSSVDHINSVRLANTLDNLQLLTHAEQMHKERTDLIRGEHESGKNFEVWGAREASRISGVSKSYIKILIERGKSLKGWKFTIIKNYKK